MEMAEIYESAEYIKADEAEVEVGKLLKQADDAANSGEEDAKQEAEDLKKQAYKLQKTLLKKVALRNCFPAQMASSICVLVS